jgi:hypothetical protein
MILNRSWLVTGGIASALLILILVYTEVHQNRSTKKVENKGSSPVRTISPPFYRDPPLGNTPTWFKEDINAITNAMNVWVAPARYSESRDVIGGCSANERLEVVVGAFEADLNTRRTQESLIAIEQELRKGAREIATGAHLRDRFCESLDLDKCLFYA